MRDLHTRIRAAFERVAVDPDILEELTQHAEATDAALRADGASEPEAIEKIDQLIEGWRRDPQSLRRVSKRAPVVIPPASSSAFASGAWADAIYGWRLLRSRPGYTAIAILTIALGVGAVTTVFSVAYGVLLRPLPWASGDNLVRIIESRGGKQGRIPGTMLNGSYLAWSDAPQTIEHIAAWSDGIVTLTGFGDAARISVASITPSLFDVVSAQPIRGRAFAAGEGAAGNAGYAILSSGLWEQRFGRRDDIVGQPILLDGTPYVVVGIMPREFAFPSAATQIWNNLSPFVYGISTRDWLSFAIAPLVLVIVGVIACVVPARRVAQTDPVQVLRET